MAKQTKTGIAAKRGAGQWWLDAGEEDCPHCDQAYWYAAEVRCFDCDAPICPMCIVRAGGHVLCPECGQATDAK
jgi:hypothetical protein